MILLLLVGSLLIVENHCQDFVFPSDDDAETKITPPRPTDTRTPVFIIGRCPPGQLLYPVQQQQDEWVCDCASGYLYYGPASKCFPAYDQGPCKETEYLVVSKNKTASECVVNPCRKEKKFVQYNNECHELDTQGPCSQGTLGVNITTLLLDCLTGPSPLVLIKFPPNCPPGSIRSSKNCRPEY